MIGLWETVVCSWALRFLTLKMSLAAHNAKFILANGQLDEVSTVHLCTSTV